MLRKKDTALVPTSQSGKIIHNAVPGRNGVIRGKGVVAMRRWAFALSLLALVGAPGCLILDSVTPGTSANPAHPGDTLNLGSQFPDQQGGSFIEICTSSSQTNCPRITITSWTTTKVTATLMTNITAGNYVLRLTQVNAADATKTSVKTLPLVVEVPVSIPDIAVSDIDAGVGQELQFMTGLGYDSTGKFFCAAATTYDNTIVSTNLDDTAGTFSALVTYNAVDGGTAQFSQKVSPGCRYLSGISSPATGWAYGNSTALGDMAGVPGDGTWDVNNSGVFVGMDLDEQSRWRWTSSGGRETLPAMIDGFATFVAAIDGNGTAYGSAVDAAFAGYPVFWAADGSLSALPSFGNAPAVYAATGDGSALVGIVGDLFNSMIAVWDAQSLVFVSDGDTAPGGGGDPIPAPGSALSVSSFNGLAVAGGGLNCGLASPCDEGSAFIVVNTASGWMKYNLQSFILANFGVDVGAVSSVRGVAVTADKVALLLSDDGHGATANKIVRISRTAFAGVLN